MLGPVGANFGAGMTGGRAYLYDPLGRQTAALDDLSVVAVRLRAALVDRPDGRARVIELIRLLEAHRGAGSRLAARLLTEADLASVFWLVEPIPVAVEPIPLAVETVPVATGTTASQPDRNRAVPVLLPTSETGAFTLGRTSGTVTPG